MKANEAPKKLYFGEFDKTCLEAYSTKESNDEIEYTRTDVFIEKTAKWINEHTSLSEKMVIENFVNYMKGE